MSQNNQVESLSDHCSSCSINDNEHFTNDLPSSDLFSDHAHPEEDGFSGIDLQNNSMNLTFSGLPQPGRYSSNTFEQHHSLSIAVPFYHNGTASSRIPGSRNSVSTLAEDTNSYTHNQQLYNVSSNNHVQLPLTPVPSVPEYNGITSAGSNSFSTNSHQYRVVGYPNSSVPGCYNGTLSTRSNSVPTSSHQYRDVMSYPNSSGPGCYNGTLSTRSNLVPTSSLQNSGQNGPPTTQHFFIDTNQYVTVSGSYEEPMDETVEEVQIASDVRAENRLELRSEWVRLHTFFRKWPNDMPPQINPSTLSQDGFYYLGPFDRVRCIFCSGILKKWDAEDIVETEHRKHFPKCPFVLGLDVGNIPLDRSAVSTNVISKSDSFGVLSVQNFGKPSNESPSERAETLGIVQNKPKHPRFSLEADRLATFKNWPSQIKQQPEQLAKAGLFYVGNSDNVKCFTCDGLLSQWEPGDDPWIEHARWFPDCQFVRLVKGDTFIEQVLQGETPMEEKETKSHSEKEHKQDSVAIQALLENGCKMQEVSEAIKWLHENGGVPDDVIPSAEKIYKIILDTEKIPNGKVVSEDFQNQKRKPPNKNSEETEDISSLLEENRELKEQKICKICLDEEISIIFLPCGHLVCCGTCASSLSECPICRGTIKGAAKAFWS
ncbi:putative inhibitor of apoptosis [Gigantopelta aegis]|uniref:putative inhibitor of apoptosis n=1 Tax=Gigantopelta aegis TaxID=1735272 RepID=UPI001B887EE5|nr:putative inhibitor of apoptosis [Gigantopelta aegis]